MSFYYLVYVMLLLSLFPTGILGGILISVDSKIGLETRHFEIISKLYLAFWVISWGLALILAFALPGFHLANAILTPILLIITSFVIWKIFKWIHSPRVDFGRAKMPFLFFLSYFVLFGFLLGIQLTFQLG